ncbi:putative Tumor necrosis factor alpha-induced protein 8-like protein 3 [Hypsibius exemplaris]|uniref:Tumor necrosis factor alpha-induced protein 8-like protein 3 n=1 Tax=Hypsibius exemplaris TaxID=2072580 RepID=A0A9X6RNQ9_HYPEX|nr:putative Tumor necrosis factor alpha-induced protein 8-like protein 3 [Hypsibius exemplaris]
MRKRQNPIVITHKIRAVLSITSFPTPENRVKTSININVSIPRCDQTTHLLSSDCLPSIHLSRTITERIIFCLLICKTCSIDHSLPLALPRACLTAMDRKSSKDDSTSNCTTAQSLSIRAQKKILGTMAGSKNVAKLFIDDRSAQLLDTLFRLTLDYTDGNRRRAEKLLKHSIKSAIKFIVLLRNDQFDSPGQLEQCREFRKKLRHAAVTFTSFYEVEFSFDRGYLSGILRDCGALLVGILQPHLTGKSIARIQDVFQFYAAEEFLQWLFVESGEASRADLKMAVEDLHQLLHENVL